MDRVALTNWAGNVRFGTERVYRPSSVEALQQLVAGAGRVRALGTGHSFNRIADAAGPDAALVSVAGLPGTVTIDPERRTATVPAGTRYGELVTRLHRAGFALPNLASLPHISVAGACATGTHGSGDRVGNLATTVSGLELVTGAGELVRLHRDTGDDADRDRFGGAVVGLGALGIVTSLTLALVPAFDVCQYVYEDLRHDTLADHWEEIFAAGYSVSVFTGWSGRYARQVWVKRRVTGRDQWRPPPRWFGARLASHQLHPIAGGSPAHCTEQLGRPGPWYARLPHFRLEFTPSSGEELQSEYLVPRWRAAEALAAIDRIRDRVAPVLQISELRTVAADELWLSPSYQRDSLAIHFTWIADPAAVMPVVAAVAEQLAPLSARPHWGKLFEASPELVRALYPRWADFAALARRLDPAGTFRNEFLDRYL